MQIPWKCSLRPCLEIWWFLRVKSHLWTFNQNFQCNICMKMAHLFPKLTFTYNFYQNGLQCLVSLETSIIICFKGTLECLELMHEKWLIFHQCMFQVIWVLLIKWSRFKFNFNNKPWNLLFEFWNKNIAGNFSLSTW